MPRPPDPESFRKACAQFATGITIVSLRAPNGTPHGLTVNSFTSVSINPPLILVCIDYGCALLPYFRLANFFAVNILTQEQRSLSISFAVKPEGRFDGIHWHAGSTGAPILSGVLAFFECRTSQIAEAGDHAIVIGEVVRSECSTGNPLVYFDSNYRVLR
jgi:flavin reductase (DIM6/NTAB) family NADH-FMN oxidoreductase RutF